jgi:hypothetical protein
MNFHKAYRYMKTTIDHHSVVKSLLIVIALSLPIIVYLFQQPHHGFEFGVYIASGHRISNGQIPYRDFFSMYGPVIPIWARVLSSLGLSPDVTERLFFFPESIFSSVALWAAWRFFNLRLRYVLLLSIGAITIYAPLFRCLNFVIVAHLLFMSTRTIKINRVYNCLSGVCATLSILYYQDVFVYIEISVLLTLITLTLTKNLHITDVVRMFSFHIVGVSLVLIPLLTYLSITESLKPYLLMNWIFPARFYSSFSFVDAPNLFSIPAAKSNSAYDKYILPVIIRYISGTLPFYLHVTAFLISAISFASCGYKTQNGNKMLVFLTVLSGLLAKLVLQTGDQIKLLMNLFIPILVIITIHQNAPRKSTIKLFSSILVLIIAINITYVPIRNFILSKSSPSRNSRTQQEASSVLGNFLRTRKIPKADCLLLPNLSYHYADELSHSPTRFDYFDPIVSIRYDEDLANEISMTSPEWVIVDYSAAMWGRRIGIDYGKKSINTIKRLYKQDWTHEGFVAYKLSRKH